MCLHMQPDLERYDTEKTVVMVLGIGRTWALSYRLLFGFDLKRLLSLVVHDSSNSYDGI